MTNGTGSVFEAIRASGAWRQLPPAVSRAVDIVDAEEKTDADGLAAAIEQTPELAAIVLRHANSAFYAPPQRVATVRDAVVRLGFEAMRNFMAAYMTSYLLPNPGAARRQFNMREYWNHVLATALAAVMLGQRAGYGDRFRLFTYGLMHDIGIIVLEACLPARLDEIVDKIEAGVPQLVAEKAVLGGVSHAEVGAWLCGEWNLAADVCGIIRYHHEPALAPEKSDALRLIYLGNMLGSRVYESNMHIALGRSPVDGRVLAALGLTPADIEAVDGELDAALAEYMEKNGAAV